jgi:pimeloyl-ACP methyl ester carboxylesterase
VTAKRVNVGAVTLHFIDEGQGPAVLMLHGFPDSSYLWRKQVPALVAAGFRVIAPDLRGFGESDRPSDVDAYALGEVVQDLVGLLDNLGVERASVVGHDWGAATGWAVGIFAPQRLDRLVAISVGHPTSFAAVGLEQLRKSWYIFLFLREGVEEALLANDGRYFRLYWENEDLARSLREISRPGALTAGLNWYRANLTPQSLLVPPPEFPGVPGPVMGIYGSPDPYLTEEQMSGSGRYVDGPWRYERIEGVGHWIPTEAPEHLNRLLLDFLSV